MASMNLLRHHFQLLLIVFALAVFAIPTAAFQTTRPKHVDKVELISIDYEKGSLERIKETKVIEGKDVAGVLKN